MTEPESVVSNIDEMNASEQIANEDKERVQFSELEINARVAFVAALAVKANYDPDSNLARRRMRMTYDGLPKKLPVQELIVLGEAAGIGATTNALASGEKIDDKSQRKLASDIGKRALYWLGDMANHNGDKTTANNAVKALWSAYGLRGKLRALELRHQNGKL